MTVSGKQTISIEGKYIEGLAADYVQSAPANTIVSFTDVKAIAWEGNNKNESFNYIINSFTIVKR